MNLLTVQMSLPINYLPQDLVGLNLSNSEILRDEFSFRFVDTNSYIEFSTEYQYRPLGQQKFFVYEAINSEHRISHGMANPLLESFGESSKACVINSSHPPANLKGKENPDLPSVCSNYWPPNVALSLCFNHLVLSTFLQCRSAIPQRSAKPIASIHHTVQYPQRNPQFNVITHDWHQ